MYWLVFCRWFKVIIYRIAIDENIEIHIGGEEQGNAEDIETDDVIKICYAEDGDTIESIFIRK